jgi:hypothetical protein
MADKKITELTPITGANLADADEFVVVDVSTDETLSVTRAEFFKNTPDITVDGTITSDVISQTGGAGTITLKDLGGSSSEIEASGTLHIDYQGSAFQIINDTKARLNIDNGGDISFYESTGTTPKFFWYASSGRLAIGGTAANAELHVHGSQIIGSNGYFQMASTTGLSPELREASNGWSMWTDGQKRMTVDSNGNVLVGKALSNSNTVGCEQNPSGYQFLTRDAGTSLYITRNTNDGSVIDFYRATTKVGSIQTDAGGINVGSGATRLSFVDGSPQRIVPRAGPSAASNGLIDLGDSGSRFDDIYAVNATIQTSDRNEKQGIASLTPTEMLVAARLSTGFINFKWKDKVVEKGDDARLHSGAIAQDVQDAFTAEGLDAGNYAMFISGTWWEHDVDVPSVEAVEGVAGVQAVEAVDYVEAVEATYDEEGIELTAYVPEVQAVEAVVGVEYVEAVEAKDAYTRTDTYDTLEDAPDGATERTRLGIRYAELLSFVAAYNEQRFTSIETRLATLEA